MKAKKVPGIPSQVKGGYNDSESILKINNPEEVNLKFDKLKKSIF